MRNSIIQAAIFLPSFVASVGAFRLKSRTLQLRRPATKERGRVDAVAIVFASSAFDPYACDVYAHLRGNGMHPEHIKLFLPGPRLTCRYKPQDAAPRAVPPDYSTGTKLPLMYLIAGQDTKLSDFCAPLRGQGHKCDSNPLPSASHLFVFCAGHGAPHLPSVFEHSPFQWLNNVSAPDALTTPDVRMTHHDWKEIMVRNKETQRYGQVLAVVLACHSAMIFARLLPTTSQSPRLGEYVRAAIQEQEGEPLLDDSIPFVVVTSTGVQTCRYSPSSNPMFKINDFLKILMSFWKTNPQGVISSAKGKLKRKSRAAQLLPLPDLISGIRAKMQRKSFRTKSSPKFFGYDQYLNNFKWVDFKLSKARVSAELESDDETDEDEGDDDGDEDMDEGSDNESDTDGD